MKSAKAAYDRFAPVYDRHTAQNDYELWLGEILLPELAKHGLQTGWALDIGCGTGRAFDALLDRRWEVVGTDVSSGMLAEADRKYGSRVRLIGADGRDLPPLCPAPAFDLVLLLNDVLNYMTDDGSLELAFAGVRRNLDSDHGLAIFDVNTLSFYRAIYTAPATGLDAGGGEWRGLTEVVEPGIVYEALLSSAELKAHIHRQRHWTPGQIKDVLEASGLRCLAALGQREEDGKILLSPDSDEERDAKVIYIVAPKQSILRNVRSPSRPEPSQLIASDPLRHRRQIGAVKR
jgi:SAM-dependent methyltransferase